MDALTRGSVSEATLRQALTRRTRHYLRPVFLGGAVIYLGFTAALFFLTPQPHACTLSVLSFATALTFAAFRWFWSRLPSTESAPRVAGVVVSGLVQANALTHIALLNTLEPTTHLMLMLLGASILMLSGRWLAVIVGLTSAGWGVTVWITGPFGNVGYFASSLLATVALAGIIHVALLRATRESERRRISAEQLQAALARALSAEAQARRELESANVAMETAIQEAEELNEMQASFLSDMSHEIRTPLTSIIGFAEVLSEDDPPEAQRFANLIRQSSERLMETVNSVLNLSKLKRGVAEFRVERVDAASLLNETVMLFEERAESNGIELSLTLPDDPVEAHLDLSSFNRICSNLIGNAVKFCNEGDAVHVTLTRSDEWFTVTVEDTGPGIRPEFRARLFEPFQRDEALTPQGTGLGLTITHRLVQSMNGTIDVDSTLGDGSTFTVRLPRSGSEG
jgi:signal transduction histidine kinase